MEVRSLAIPIYLPQCVVIPTPENMSLAAICCNSRAFDTSDMLSGSLALLLWSVLFVCRRRRFLAASYSEWGTLDLIYE